MLAYVARFLSQLASPHSPLPQFNVPNKRGVWSAFPRFLTACLARGTVPAPIELADAADDQLVSWPALKSHDDLGHEDDRVTISSSYLNSQ